MPVTPEMIRQHHAELYAQLEALLPETPPGDEF